MTVYDKKVNDFCSEFPLHVFSGQNDPKRFFDPIFHANFDDVKSILVQSNTFL